MGVQTVFLILICICCSISAKKKAAEELRQANNKDKAAPKKSKVLTEEEREIEKVRKAIEKEKKLQEDLDKDIAGLRSSLEREFNDPYASKGAYSGKTKKINEMMRRKSESQKKVSEYYDHEARILHKQLKEIEKSKMIKLVVPPKPKINVRPDANLDSPGQGAINTERKLIDPEGQA